MLRNIVEDNATFDIILKNIASHLHGQDLKTLATVSRRATTVAHGRLFRQFKYSVRGDDRTLELCYEFLYAGKKSVGQHIRILALHGDCGMVRPALSTHTVYEFLAILPNVRRLELKGFRWESGRRCVLPANKLTHIAILSTVSTAVDDSPLSLLQLVPKWYIIRLSGLDHAIIPTLPHELHIQSHVVIFDHHPYSDPTVLLPASNMRFSGVKILFAHCMDKTHAKAVTQLIDESASSLRYVAVTMNREHTSKSHDAWY